MGVAVKWDGLGPYRSLKPSGLTKRDEFGAVSAPKSATLAAGTVFTAAAPRTASSMPALDVRPANRGRYALPATAGD